MINWVFVPRIIMRVNAESKLKGSDHEILNGYNISKNSHIFVLSNKESKP